MVTTDRQPITEPYSLTQIDTGLIPSGNRNDGLADTWIKIWQFQVPDGIAMILGPADIIALYLEDAAAEVGNNTAEVRISIGDTSQYDNRVIFGPVPYINVKEFQDTRKVARLRLPEAIKVYEKQFINIEVKDDGAIDESDSRFLLEMTRIRQGLS